MYPKNLITQILETAFMLAFAAFLIKTAIGWIMEVWPALLTTAIIITAIIIGIRIWRYKHDKDLGEW